MNTKEILLYLKEGLEKGEKYMCHILKEIGIDRTFLKSSGIEAMWLELPNSKIAYSYTLTLNHNTTKEDYTNLLINTKLEIINKLLEK